METRSKPRSGYLGYVVNIGSFVSANRFVSTQGANHELYRHRPPQKDYQCLRDEPRSQSAQAANPALPRTEADCGLLPTVGGEFQAVVEATASYEWPWQLLEPLAQRLVLAHRRSCGVIAESKNKSDKLDAQVLADSLALDMIPRGIPSHAASTTQIVISMSESRNQRLLLTPNILSFQKQSAGEPSERQHWQLLTPSRASEMS
jgi:hypothetical protein